MGKLVRDNIPKMIKASGRKPLAHIADIEEYGEALKQKIREEIRDFLENENKEEMADVFEILYAMCDFKEFDLKEIESIRKYKAQKRGKFKDKIILDGVND